ncbi:conserved protein of unknown function [Bradyrhizobium sp. ORS 285]|uniref:hypothetical protein n=1 Tax=Bradyrhizobium sp. ORS 285 TaxID=115808 RepID=UPI000B57916A|nr:hypothetical protein [Bradyrhizobium sp. ORS 285]SMX56850.1 conserved protein of unknown function [Bradyrhizobium sp. ORS 285]
MPGPSTRDVHHLPDIVSLKRLLQSVAMLDAIICPDWEYRYYSFNANWAAGEMMGSMRNGQGDEFFVLFNSHGAFIKGFDHGSVVASLRLPGQQFYRDLPGQFASCCSEPAFSPEFVTFCMWRLLESPAWSSAATELASSGDSDGSARLLSILDRSPETYRRWASEYYERDVPSQAVIAVYEHRVLTDEIVAAINPTIDPASLGEDIAQIGYST